MTTESMNFQGRKSTLQITLSKNPRMAVLEMYLSSRISPEKCLSHPQIENDRKQTLRGDEQVSSNFPLKVR